MPNYLKIKALLLLPFLSIFLVSSFGALLDDKATREISDMEAKLAQSVPSSDESARAMLGLISLYKKYGHVFGLIRTATLFSSAQSSHPENERVMLVGIDALKATSSHTSLQAACRQFVESYPKSDSSLLVWRSLAQSLSLAEPKRHREVGDAYANAWKLNPSVVGIEDAVQAIRFYSEHNKTESHFLAASIAKHVLDSVGPTPLSAAVAAVGFESAGRANDLRLADSLGSALLKLPHNLSRIEQSELHRNLADIQLRLDQPANAINHYQKSLLQHPSPDTHLGLIRAQYAAKQRPAEIRKSLATFLDKHPDHRDRQEAVLLVGRAYATAGNPLEAATIIESEFSKRELSRAILREYLTWLDSSVKAAPTRAQEALLRAADKLPDSQSWRHRWVLAFDLYRDRNHDTRNATKTVRSLLFDHPVNEQSLAEALAWLLDNGGSPDADIAKYFDTSRSHPHFTSYQGLLAPWVKAAEENKDKRTIANRIQGHYEAMLNEPQMKLWRTASDSNEHRARDARDALLKRDDLSDPQRRVALASQAYYYRHRVGESDRGVSVSLFAALARLEPVSYDTARAWIDAAASYGTPDLKRQAINHLLSFKAAVRADGFAFSRLAAIAASLEDAGLAKRAVAWISATERRHGLAKDYLSDTGSSLAAAGLQDEAASFWRSHISAAFDSRDSQQCAHKYLEQIPKDGTGRRITFIEGLLKNSSRNHGAYSAWLADIHLKSKDLDAFESTLITARKHQDQRPFKPWGMGDQLAQDWIRGACEPTRDWSELDRGRILTLISDLRNGLSSAAASLALLDLGADTGLDRLDQLVVCYNATRTAGRHHTSWDWLKPYAQRRIADGRYAQAAAVYSGLLNNVGSVGADTIADTRSKIRAAYASLGTLSLEVAPGSPVAPLMEIGLHLRLDDQASAVDTYRHNLQIFDAHRDELPIEIIAFAAQTHIDEGTPSSQARAEDILRSWLIKFGDNEKIPISNKATIQLLLARSYQAAQRFDVARAEFTTVVNQFPETAESIEATFGIGETFLDQKIYDEAESIFSDLASNSIPRIRVRAEFLRGVLALRRDDRGTARKIFREVLQSMPDLELADRTLFQLAEVYGLEKRFLDQLQLLRTVGRLGRESKSWHVPGHALSVVVQDTDLGISRGNGRIPVAVTTEPGGDSETTYLTSGGAGKGLFLGEIDTVLGTPKPGDGAIQVLGGDVISVRYPEDFAAEFADVHLGTSEIRIASDGAFAMASSWIEDPVTNDTPDAARTAEEQRISELLKADRRPGNQIKPGNLVYFRVSDPDRSLTADIDQIPIKVRASSGDEVQVKLVETGATTGIFRGNAQTADLPAGATASDTAIGHSPLMAIDRNPETSWRSEPDGVTPKHLEIDMKNLFRVEDISLSTPSPKHQSPVRFSVLGSHDGRFFYEIAKFPVQDAPQKPEGGFARMSRRLFPLENPNVDSWNKVLDLAKRTEIQSTVTESMSWPDIPSSARSDEFKGSMAVLWQGLFNQPRDGAVRFELSGHRIALMVDGQLLLPPTPDEGSADVYLSTGAHELSAFVVINDASSETAMVLRARENPNSAAVRLASFGSGDFSSPDMELAKFASPSVVKVEGGNWTITVPPRELRQIRLHIHEFVGEAVAINSVSISAGDSTPIPPNTDLLALASNSTLEIAPGDSITGTYIDQFTANGVGRNRSLSQSMAATYFNGQVLAVSNDFLRAPNGSVLELRKEVLRIDPGERITIEVTDYDLDQTGQADSIMVNASVQGKGRPSIILQAQETGPSTGVFRAEFDTVENSSTPSPSTLAVAAGDTIFLHYEDADNTFPGHRARREVPIYIRRATDADIRIVETKFIHPTPSSDDQSPEPEYLLPRPPTDLNAPKSIAYELPLTVSVVDPDAARDTRSTVAVDLTVAGRPAVRVLCEISRAFAPENPGLIDVRNPALHEGRFVGQIQLQLGSENSLPTIPVTDNDTSGALIGTVLPADVDSTPLLSSDPLVPVLNLTGSDIVEAAYSDESPSTPALRTHRDYAQLASDAQLSLTDPKTGEPATLLRVGERLYVSLSDPDLDLSDARDATAITVTTSTGERESLPLEETLSHSGIFTASFPLKAVEEPTKNNFDPSSPAVEAFFGANLTASYNDQRPPAGTEPGPQTIAAPIAVGTDGTVSAFSKLFGDEQLAIQTQFHIAESYFELFKSHRELGRAPEAEADLEAGRRTLQELQSDYPDPKYAPRVAYLLGQFAQELADWVDAIAQYESVVRDYPEHTLAPDAQYKLGQCYEESQRFEEALDAYVGLAATYPESPLIASVMIRIADRFYKQAEYLAAAGVGEKFLLRFDSHQWTPRIAFRVGQCYYKADKYETGGAAFDTFIKNFPDDDLAAQSLFWAGESYRMAGNVPEAFRRYNRCRWDYPESDAAKYSRGRLALPEMLAQFEREAQLDDAN